MRRLSEACVAHVWMFCAVVPKPARERRGRVQSGRRRGTWLVWHSTSAALTRRIQRACNKTKR